MLLRNCLKNTINVARLTRGWRWVEPPSRTLRAGGASGPWPSLTAAPPNAGDIAGRNQKTALQPNQKTGREKKLKEITLERD
jgi:hypothetical protein